MLRPMRMKRVNILFLKEDEAALLRTMAEMECVQVADVPIAGPGGSFSPADTRSTAASLEDLRSRLDEAARILALSADNVPDDSIRVEPLGIADSIRADLEPIEKQIRELDTLMKGADASREKADVLAWALAGIAHAGIDIDALMTARYVAVELGSVPRGNFPRLRETLELSGHRLFVLGSIGARTLVCGVTSPDRKSELADGLDAARFERIVITPELIEADGAAPRVSEEAMWEVRESLTEAGLALARIAAEKGLLINTWRREIDVNARLLAASESFLAAAYTHLASGWVPASRLDALEGALAARCTGPVEIVSVAFKEASSHEGPAPDSPPTSLSNSFLFRPFQRLVEFYGYPAYDGIDPTAFVAFTFAFMFGAMFGDAGHGLVLLLAGIITASMAAKRSVGRDVGAILIWCGSTSILFGFVYGSFFGVESEHMALWKSPMSDPGGFLFAGVILGAVVINLGLVINFIQNLWARKYKEAFVGEWGGSTMLFYWGVCGLFYLAANGKGADVTATTVALILGPPLFLTTFGIEIVDRLTGHKGEHEMAGLFIRPMELMMGSFSNTISFMRVSAFALNHAALMGTVFVFASMLKSPGPVGSAMSGLDIFIGNIMVICLEGVMVFVQVLRLHYYEFFSKFFLSQGRPFEPLSLSAKRSIV